VTEPDKADTERLCELLELGQMRIEFVAGLVQGLHRRARQLELATRLQRDRATTGDIGQTDRVVALHDRLPAEQPGHTVKQPADAAARAFIRHW
jgi:hypothetical protein